MRAFAATAVLLLLAARGAGHAEVQGGGLANTDCRMVFRGVTATNDSSGVVCTDGDPTCDADGIADGTCSFAVRLCTGTSTSSCDTTPLSSASVGGLDLTPPRLPTFDGTCGPILPVAVQDGKATGATVIARDGSSLRDVDYLNLCCVAGESTALDVARCAVGIDLGVSGCPMRKIRAPRAWHSPARTTWSWPSRRSRAGCMTCASPSASSPWCGGRRSAWPSTSRAATRSASR